VDPTATPFVSASQLTGAWADRDKRYAQRKKMGQLIPLDAREIDAILTYRGLEVRLLPLEEQSRARRDLANWRPPVETR
jgi:hypothetical protein